MSAEKKTRNQKLLEDFESGKFSLVALIKKYNLSPSRIYFIVERERAKKE